MTYHDYPGFVFAPADQVPPQFVGRYTPGKSKGKGKSPPRDKPKGKDKGTSKKNRKSKRPRLIASSAFYWSAPALPRVSMVQGRVSNRHTFQKLLFIVVHRHCPVFPWSEDEKTTEDREREELWRRHKRQRRAEEATAQSEHGSLMMYLLAELLHAELEAKREDFWWEWLFRQL